MAPVEATASASITTSGAFSGTAKTATSAEAAAVTRTRSSSNESGRSGQVVFNRESSSKVPLDNLYKNLYK